MNFWAIGRKTCIRVSLLIQMVENGLSVSGALAEIPEFIL